MVYTLKIIHTRIVLHNNDNFKPWELHFYNDKCLFNLLKGVILCANEEEWGYLKLLKFLKETISNRHLLQAVQVKYP